jgi:hypothetical protein
VRLDNEATRRATRDMAVDPPLSREERRLIEALRSHPWGEATVVMKGGKPVMVKGIREDVKLTDG